MNELKSEQFLNIVENKLSELEETVLQTKINYEEKIPCRIINTPLESVSKTQNSIPILKVFQISIEHWSNSQYECIEMASKTDEKLREYNMIRTNTNQCLYDLNSQKYNLVITYEARWEALTNSFICIK